MALGSAHALGFKLPQNFNRPYLATSIGDFWRRWHITLSSWVRDYIFIPLGGSRHGPWRTYGNFLVTMIALGFWHGAGWTFGVFGLYHGIWLCIERAFPYPSWTNRGAMRVLRIAWTMFLFCVSLVIFRSPTLLSAGHTLTRMLLPTAGATLAHNALFTAISISALVLAAQWFANRRLARRVQESIPAPVFGVGLAVLFLVIQLLMPEDAQPFIYFQF
jgi:D-alanyl-lipoteichoic acid acyltransferase DltB (MBOAT superfamily)